MSSAAAQENGANPLDPGYYGSDELRAFGFKSVGDRVMVARNATIIGLPNVVLGDDVRIDGNVVIAAGSGHFLAGSHIHLGGGCFLGCAGGITMGDFSGLSQGVRVYSGSDDYSGNFMTNPTVPLRYRSVTRAPVAIGRHVIIGAGTVVLPGVTIGEGASVGALCLVSKSLEPWSVNFGAPTRRLRSRSKALLALETAFLAEKHGSDAPGEKPGKP